MEHKKVEYTFYCKDCKCDFFAQSSYTETVKYCPICGSEHIFLSNPTKESKYRRIDI